MTGPFLFGVRHLSPRGAWAVRKLLDQKKPELVLVEGPSDLSGHLADICSSKTVPPIAIMAYTKESPIRTILYPLAVYSPEYQAIRWAFDHHVPCRFMDLPSGVMLSLEQGVSADPDRDSPDSMTTESVYRRIGELSGGEDHDSFWERHFEHLDSAEEYREAAAEFGRGLRLCADDGKYDTARNLVREAYMKRQIQDAVHQGIAPEKIFCVCGAYHVAGLEQNSPLTDQEISELPRMESLSTLMPYSYYRLSSRSGYGAGNKAPAYFELLWDVICKGEVSNISYQYLVRLAAAHRAEGNLTSSAEVIEAVRLAKTLASLHGGEIPCLQDLHDAATTCMGHGRFSEISVAAAGTEIGTKIGTLPEGVSRTSVQEDFYVQLRDLRLEKYKSAVAQPLELDLREKLNVKSEKSAFLDLNRSFFLHRLRILGIHFAHPGSRIQEKANWAELWTLQWTPESEIEIVEAALLGDSIVGAASFALKERGESSQTIAQAASIVTDSFLCGMPESVKYAVSLLQSLSTDAAALTEIADTAENLSVVIRYGSLRHLDPTPLIPLLSQLFFRACLLVCPSCNCDHQAAGDVIQALEKLNSVQLNHDFLEEEAWLNAITELSDRDDLNTKCSGYAAAILLERNKMEDSMLAAQVSRRLSKGTPAELGASWFEGLAQKNHYSLIARLSLWEQLSNYLDTLDSEEFKRALVFLRRAFADFQPGEKSDIAENLGEVWGLNRQDTADQIRREATPEETELLESLDEFNFDDL